MLNDIILLNRKIVGYYKRNVILWEYKNTNEWLQPSKYPLSTEGDIRKSYARLHLYNPPRAATRRGIVGRFHLQG